jgi:hypothetical protein
MSMSCCFCLNDITQYESITTLTCGHKFHTICFRQDIINNACPLCRQNKSIDEQTYADADIPTYDPDDYVWVFGSFLLTLNNVQTHSRFCVTRVIANKNYVSGCCWRLFEEAISNKLEQARQEGKTEFEIEIGVLTYKINDRVTLDNGIETFLQTSVLGKIRPVARMQWKDVVNLTLVGIHDKKLKNVSYE